MVFVQWGFGMNRQQEPKLSKGEDVDGMVSTRPLSHDAETTLEHVLNIMPKLVYWLIKSGVGYTEFAAALRPVFYNEAIKELECIKQKKTDSSISLLSGLNRRDVREFRELKTEHELLTHNAVVMPISVPARVIGVWINNRLPNKIPIAGGSGSFENLVKQISSEKHPRSILLELKRIGVIIEEDEYVILQTGSFTPTPKMDESKQLFTENISDHLAAGLHNLVKNDNAFLEQAIFADELTENSIEELKKLSSVLWEDMVNKIVSVAIEQCKKDENSPNANQRFRLGVFQYNDKYKD